MYTTFLPYYSSYKFSKFIQGKSPLLQQLASVSLLKEKSKMCPKLNFSRGMARLFVFATLCQSAHPLKHSLAESIFFSRVQKTAKKKSSLVEKFVNRFTRQPRYHFIYLGTKQNSETSCHVHPSMPNFSEIYSVVRTDTVCLLFGVSC